MKLRDKQIQNLFTSVDLQMYSGQYTGTGAYGSNNPVSITFPFATPIVFIPNTNTSGLNGFVPRPLYAAQLSTTSWTNIASDNARNLYAKVSQDNKTYYWYADYYSTYESEAYYNAYNINGVVYFYVGFGGYDVGGQTEWILTNSQTWTVPRTGKYYIELYGGGGRAGCPKGYGCSGRSSCQSYNNVNLLIRQEISVVIGTRGNSDTSTSSEYTRDGTSGTETKFGTYSVDGGKVTNYGGSYQNGFVIQIGAATGNLGTQGYAGVKNTPNSRYGIGNYSNGRYGDKYGYGGFAKNKTNDYATRNGGPRAVYLKYLGA